MVLSVIILLKFVLVQIPQTENKPKLPLLPVIVVVLSQVIQRVKILVLEVIKKYTNVMG